MTRVVLAAALLIATAALALPIAAAQPEGPTAALTRALQLVRGSRDIPDAGRRAEALSSALRALEASPGLAVSAWLREPLTAVPPDVDRAEQRLASALALLSGDAVPSDAAADRRALDQILAGPNFHPYSWRSLIPVWLLPAVIGVERLLQLLWNILRWPFDRLLELIVRALTFGPSVLVLGLIVVVGLVALYARTLRGAIVGQAEVAPADSPLPPTAREALHMAQEEAARGHYREASHYLFASTLLWLEEQGRFSFDPSATNQEHLASVSADPTVAAGLRPFVIKYDRVWYGQEQISSQDYGELTQLAGRLRETLT